MFRSIPDLTKMPLEKEVPRVQLCCICEKPLWDKPERIQRTVCNHLFHETCITHWITTCQQCPECYARADVKDLKQFHQGDVLPQATGAIRKHYNTRLGTKTVGETQDTGPGGGAEGKLDEDANITGDSDRGRTEKRLGRPPGKKVTDKVPNPMRRENPDIHNKTIVMTREHVSSIDYERIGDQLERIVTRKLQEMRIPEERHDAAAQRNINTQWVGSPNSGRGSSRLGVIQPDKVAQIMHSWGIKFDGSIKGITVEEFCYRIRTLTEDCLDNDFEALCKNLHVLLIGKTREWYWRYRKDNSTLVWSNLSQALRLQYANYRNDFDILEDIRARKQHSNESFESFHDAIMAMASQMSRPIEDAQLVEILTRNLLFEIRQEMLYVPIKSMAHLRKLVQMRENLLQGIGVKRITKPPGAIPPRNRVAEICEDSSERDENEFGIEAIQAPRKVYRCWNCDQEGHGWDMCLQERKVFCYGCGAKNTYKPKCPVCIARKSENAQMGSFGATSRMVPKQ